MFDLAEQDGMDVAAPRRETQMMLRVPFVNRRLVIEAGRFVSHLPLGCLRVSGDDQEVNVEQHTRDLEGVVRWTFD